jgi:O-antigen ligase
MSETAGRASVLRQAAAVLIIMTATASPFSIAIAQSLLALTVALWLGVLAAERRGPRLPRFAIPLGIYAGITLISAALSADPWSSLADCKQLLLLLIVPLTYDLMSDRLAEPATSVVLAGGAASAAVAIAQYAFLNYDNLGLRAHSTLGLYMTFAGVIMLMLGLAVSRVLFARHARLWPALLIPALSVALALTLTRNAWVGAFAAVGLLLALRDFRLMAILPLVAAAFLTFAPTGVVDRFYSIFDAQDPTNRDRVAMLRAGMDIVQSHPLAGVGPNMLEREYPAYRLPEAVLATPPHLHNVPLQIAAERGLPALAVWIWFIVALVTGLWQLFRSRTEPWAAAAGLAAVVSMLSAGLFEYNFGDSEFQMLWLFIVTLPFAVGRTASRG